MKNLSQPANRVYKTMLLWSAFLVLPVGSSLAGTDLLGRVVILGQRDTDAPLPVPDTAVAIQGAGETRTNPQGRFRLVLPFNPGVAVTAEVRHPGHVIYHPYRGEFRLPARTEGQPAKPVDIELLPEGSSRLMDDYTFKLFAEQLKHDALDEIRPEGSPAEIDFSRYLADLGRRLGFSLQDIEQGLADWRTRKQADPDTDPYELGLAALTAQNFDEARRLFRRSRLENESALLQEEQRLAQLQDQIAERRRLVIRDLRAEGQAASLDYDFAAALDLFQKALTRSDRAADPQGWAEAMMDVAGAHYQLGIRVGGAASRQHLAESVAAYRAALEVYTRAELPQQWATTHNNLGNALGDQGIRTGGEEGRRLLAAAVAAYRAALEVYTRAELPQQWATTQNNLGNALGDQGTRTGGEEGRRLLAAAVAAYRAALEVYTRAELPQQWATTHNNLGAALRDQGTRTGGEEGRRLLAESVAAYRAALEVYTRAELPQQWATTHNNLGNALRDQGTRTGGEEGRRLLAAAVAAYRAALEVYTRAELPQQWATTHNNLGNALQEQGTRTGGEEGRRLLAAAVAAYRAALEVRTRAELPQQWAMTQNNLGAALRAQGIRTGGEEGRRLLAAAVAAYRAALEVYTRALLPQDWAMTQNNLGNALGDQGTRTGGEEGRRLLAAAVAAYRAALEVYTRAELPQQWATTHNNLGAALRDQGTRTGGEEGRRLLAESVAAYRAALEVRTFDFLPPQWAQTQMNLLRAFEAQDDAAGMFSVIEALLRAEPDSEEIYNAAQALYHETLFDFAAAHRLTGAWLQRHPDDLGAQCNFAENHFTTGRFSEAELRLAALIQEGHLPPETESALRLLEIANLLAIGKSDAAGAKLKTLKTLVQAQPEGVTVGWTFAGTAHFIANEPSLTDHREMLRGLIEAAQSGVLQTLVSALDSALDTLNTAD